MKAIFLDIDGVLNCKRTRNPRKLPYVVQPNLVARLLGILEQTAAEVVLSSTWRYDPAGVFSAKFWDIPFVDVIPDCPGRPRRDEILAWLEDHPEVKRFAVIDDEDDELDDLPLFQPFATTGLTDEVADAVVAYLNGVTDRDMRRSRIARLVGNIHGVLAGHQG